MLYPNHGGPGFLPRLCEGRAQWEFLSTPVQAAIHAHTFHRLASVRGLSALISHHCRFTQGVLANQRYLRMHTRTTLGDHQHYLQLQKWTNGRFWQPDEMRCLYAYNFRKPVIILDNPMVEQMVTIASRQVSSSQILVPPRLRSEPKGVSGHSEVDSTCS